MKKDEFEVIKNPLFILGGNGDPEPGGGGPGGDAEEQEKEERTGWRKFWDWVFGRK